MLKHGLFIFVIEYFYIEEMRRYFIMGRGRKGLLEQSKRKKKASGAFGVKFTYLSVSNREIKKIFVPEQAFDFMKNMNPQELVDFLLPNDDDWHVKTSSGNASGS